MKRNIGTVCDGSFFKVVRSRGRLTALIVSGIILTGCSDQEPKNADSESEGNAAARNQAGKVFEYHAAYDAYENLQDIVSDSDAIVRGTISSARIREVYPEVSSEVDPAINPQAGLTKQEIANIEPVITTVFTMQVSQVLDGDSAMKQVEISQLGGVVGDTTYTAPGAPSLKVDPNTEYLVLLAAHGPSPYDMLNPTEALYKAKPDGTLTPVDKNNKTKAKSLTEIKDKVKVKKDKKP